MPMKTHAGQEPAKQATLRSTCPVAGALDLIGDRWTLLVVRDLMRGKRRYGDLAASSERIPTNILADRLRRLEHGGLVERVQYNARPPRYEYRLTARGEDLRPAIRSLAAWGLQYVPGTRPPRDSTATTSPAETTDTPAG
jgi:DNA-binding HxlR family transcriptional regulator